MTGKAPSGASRFADLLQPEARRAALERRLVDAREESYWRSLPWVRPDAQPRNKPPAARHESDERQDQAPGDLLTEGWARCPSAVAAPLVTAALERVEQVLAHGWPAVFALAFDETWEALCCPSVVGAVEERLGAPASLWPGAWVHRVDTDAGASGWAPHADEPDAPGLTSDGRPARVSGWLALTPATLDNGCMHVVTADVDTAALRAGKDPSWASATAALHHARPLEAAPGDLLLWRTDTLHWGGRRRETASGARVALTFEVAPTSLQPPSRLWAAPFAPPSFDERLRRIGYALSAYGHHAEREPLAHRFAPLAEELMR